jgi:hypothetical protein
MTTLAEFPYMKAEFDKKGKPLDADLPQKVNAWLSAEGTTDLLVLSHGWNNDMQEAAALYTRLATNVSAVMGTSLQGRKLAILGVFWPSKKFADSELIPGGAASADSDIEDEALIKQIDGLHTLVEDELQGELTTLQDLAPRLENDPASRVEFFRHSRNLFGAPDGLAPEDRDEIPDAFLEATSDDEIATLFNELRKPDPAHLSTSTTESGAAGFSFSGIKAGAQRLLNYATYYKMKARAREIGRKALNPLLSQIKGKHPGIRIHLVGHSFGGLLVTSATLGEPNGASLPVNSLTLLQAAFSHNGFADQMGQGKNGHYRGVLANGRLKGPILITHTRKDKAVGVAYALASRFSGQTASNIGDPNDPYGGMGANGAQKTSQSVVADLEDVGFSYQFDDGKVYNLLADPFITGHSDVTGKQVAHLIVAAVKG